MANAVVEPTRTGILGVVVIAALFSLLAVRVVSSGMGRTLARSSPTLALRWSPGTAEARVRLAELKDRQGATPNSRVAAARSAIQASPLDGRGYRILAHAVEGKGDIPAAAALYSIAAARGPRDIPTLKWLVRRALEERDYAGALTRIDQVLRVQPEMAAKLSPVLIVLSVDPASRPDLENLLLQSPPWRASFVLQLIQESPDSKSLFKLMEKLRTTKPGISDAELSTWLDRLGRERRWGAAYLTWVQSLPADASRLVGNVYNGGFERDPRPIGFDWRIDPVPGAWVSRSQVTGSTGLALKVSFDDRRVPFEHVRQLLALAPGSYRLDGRVRLDDLRSGPGLVWTLTCAEDHRGIAETDPFSGRKEWRPFSLKFNVPSTECGGQWLTLRVPARIPAEQRIGGTAWFDDLQVKASHEKFMR